MKKIFMNLCNSDEKRHPKVDALLRHWRDARTISWKRARSLWPLAKTSDSSFIAYLERKQDRIDMAEYELIGDFGIENALASEHMAILSCLTVQTVSLPR